MDPQFEQISLKYLPIKAEECIADILDDPYGNITMEIFGENINKLLGYKLKLKPNTLKGFRHIPGKRPTVALLDHLRKRKVTIGDVLKVLDDMNVDTTDIYRFEHEAINLYCAEHRQDNRLPSENSDSSPSLEWQNYPLNERPYFSRQSSGLILNKRPLSQQNHPFNVQNMDRHFSNGGDRPKPDQEIGLPNGNERRNPNCQASIPHMSRNPPSRNRLQPRCQTRNPNTDRRLQHGGDRRHPCLQTTNHLSRITQPGRSNENCLPNNNVYAQSDQYWVPPSCDCNESDCDECENQRLLDPEETVRLSVPRSPSETRNHLRRNITDSSIRSNNISYHEDPSESVDLRCEPDGVSYHPSLQANKLKCTCLKPHACPVVCTCPGKSRPIKPPRGQSHHRDTKRWSDSACNAAAPNTNSSTLSSSDDGIGYLSTFSSQSEPNRSKRVFISFTDDKKEEVVNLAEWLKNQGLKVNTDLPTKRFAKAREEGLVTEGDQMTWLRNKFTNANVIILCLSKGFEECVNTRNMACPSPLYLNARYIYDLIRNNNVTDKDIIGVTFGRCSYRPDIVSNVFELPKDEQELNISLQYSR